MTNPDACKPEPAPRSIEIAPDVLARCEEIGRKGAARLKEAEPAQKLCPFCGGVGDPLSRLREGHHVDDPEAFCHFIACRSCAAEGPWCKSGESGAWKGWNQRVQGKG
jgi:hypothetical protein